MTKEEFLAKLKEDKFFENPQELIDYRLPIIQYYLNNFTDVTILTPEGVINNKHINIKYNPETDFTLVNQSWDKIKSQFIK